MTTMRVDPVLAIMAVPSSDGVETLIAGRESGIHTSADRGQTWTPRWRGGLGTTLTSVSDGLGSEILLAGINGGILRSRDGGEDWEPCVIAQPPPLVSSLVTLENAAHEGVVLAATHEDGVYRSMDGGETWTSANLGLYLSRMSALHATGKQRAVAASECCVFETTNAGSSWDVLAGIELDSGIIALAGNERGLAMGTTDGTIVIHDLQRQRQVGQIRIAADEEILGMTWQRDDMVVIAEETMHRIAIVMDGDTITIAAHASVPLPMPATYGGFQRSDSGHWALVGHLDGSVSIYATTEIR